MPEGNSSSGIPRLAVLLSGGGRTLANILEKIDAGSLPVEIATVISSHPGVYGLERAHAAGLPSSVVHFREFEDEAAFSNAITEAVDASNPDLVVMAGFVRKWNFPDRYRFRVLNIHPALLPDFGGQGFYGDRVHRAVIESGKKYSGCTVHFADLEYDRGPIILQRQVPVHADDTPDALAHRIFEEECVAYPEAIRLFAEKRLEIRDGEVVILPSERERSV